MGGGGLGRKQGIDPLRSGAAELTPGGGDGQKILQTHESFSARAGSQSL